MKTKKSLKIKCSCYLPQHYLLFEQYKKDQGIVWLTLNSTDLTGKKKIKAEIVINKEDRQNIIDFLKEHK